MPQRGQRKDAVTVWKRHLQNLVQLALRIEGQHANQRFDDNISKVAYVLLVNERRLAQAILRLVPHHALEALILARTAMETAANLEWIRLREEESRAERFLAYRPVQRVRRLEGVPEKHRPGYHDEYMALRKEEREALAGMFGKPGPNGAIVWDTSWAKDGDHLLSKFKERVHQIACDGGDGDPNDSRTRFYWMYGVFSARVHAEIEALEDIIECTEDGRIRAATEQLPHHRTSALVWGAQCLLDVVEHAVQLFAPTFACEFLRLRAESDRLAPVLREA